MSQPSAPKPRIVVNTRPSISPLNPVYPEANDGKAIFLAEAFANPLSYKLAGPIIAVWQGFHMRGYQIDIFVSVTTHGVTRARKNEACNLVFDAGMADIQDRIDVVWNKVVSAGTLIRMSG